MRPPGGKDWTGAVSITAEITGEATPGADVELLISADVAVFNAITQPYAQCGHAFDGATSAMLTTRRFGCMVAPAGLSAHAWLAAWGTPDIGAIQAPVEIESTSSGWPPPAGVDLIVVPSPQQGTAAFGEVAASVASPEHWQSGDTDETGPTAAINRRIELAGSLSPTMEEFQVKYCAGFGLNTIGRTPDLE